MSQYLWLCDINHLKREELKENQTERAGEVEREREEGAKLYPDELHFPPSLIQGQYSVSLKLQFNS